MTIYVSTTFARLHSPITEVLASLAERGITKVELGSIHCYEPELDIKLKQLDMQYLVHNYFPPPQDNFVSNIASLSDEIRTRSLEHSKSSISFCRKIGAPLYTFHPGFMTDPIGESHSTENYDFRFSEASSETLEEIYEICFRNFLASTRQLCQYAKDEGIALAIETQGSLSQSNQLFLQRPAEFQRLMEIFSPAEIGINLNIGHLNLAARAFDFDRFEFVNQIADYIVAMELSHNEGQKDDHAPLVAGAWYWDIICDSRFQHAFKIFEGRDLSVDTILEMVSLLEANTN